MCELHSFPSTPTNIQNGKGERGEEGEKERWEKRGERGEERGRRRESFLLGGIDFCFKMIVKRTPALHEVPVGHSTNHIRGHPIPHTGRLKSSQGPGSAAHLGSRNSHGAKTRARARESTESLDENGYRSSSCFLLHPRLHLGPLCFMGSDFLPGLLLCARGLLQIPSHFLFDRRRRLAIEHIVAEKLSLEPVSATLLGFHFAVNTLPE